MHAEFWHKKWQEKQIGFHLNQANPLLVKYFNKLNLDKNSRVFVPLCGKTLDIHWLLNNGYQVVGCELSEIAIAELFTELAIEPEIQQHNSVLIYRGPGIEIFVGDFFNLTAEQLGSIHAIYDRAAYVALPADIRGSYARHLTQICQCAPQLLICFQYNQQQMAGPPFSIEDAEIKQHYQLDNGYQLKLLDRPQLQDGLKGVAAQEVVWHLATDRRHY